MYSFQFSLLLYYLCEVLISLIRFWHQSFTGLVVIWDTAYFFPCLGTVYISTRPVYSLRAGNSNTSRLLHLWAGKALIVSGFLKHFSTKNIYILIFYIACFLVCISFLSPVLNNSQSHLGDGWTRLGSNKLKWYPNSKLFIRGLRG